MASLCFARAGFKREWRMGANAILRNTPDCSRASGGHFSTGTPLGGDSRER